MALTFDLIYASLKEENAALREAYTEQQALIRQMLESMCWAARVMTISEDEAPGYFAAIAAARAAHEGKSHDN